MFGSALYPAKTGLSLLSILLDFAYSGGMVLEIPPGRQASVNVNAVGIMPWRCILDQNCLQVPLVESRHYPFSCAKLDRWSYIILQSWGNVLFLVFYYFSVSGDLVLWGIFPRLSLHLYRGISIIASFEGKPTYDKKFWCVLGSLWGLPRCIYPRVTKSTEASACGECDTEDRDSSPTTWRDRRISW